MPFTPYHLGPALLLGYIFLRWLDLPTFLVANVIVDIEPFLVLTLGLDYPLHGIFHSYLIGGFVAIMLYFTMLPVRHYLNPFMKYFRVDQRWSNRSLCLSSILGVWIHITLDSILYTDIQPLYPLNYNPFFIGPDAITFVYSLCTYSGLLAIILFTIKYLKKSG